MGLMIIGAAFLFVRAMHIWGLYLPVNAEPPVPRQIGVLGTWIILAILSRWTVWMLVTGNL